MSAATHAVTGVSADVYAEIQHFYARQVHFLDNCVPEGFAATFAEDGELIHASSPEPVRGRDALLDAARRSVSALPPGAIRRHWFNMIVADPDGEGRFRAVHYALVITTQPGGQPVIGSACVGHDILIRDPEDGRLLVRSRRIENDSVPR
jgi:actinorhodin biosynthesis protein ActVIA